MQEMDVKDTFTLKRSPGCEVRSRPNMRFTETQTEWLKKKVDELLEKGFISPIDKVTDEGWNSSINLVPKADKPGEWRMTINYAPTVNPQIENDDYALPLPIDLCQHLSKFEYFCKIDLSNGFWRMFAADEATKQMLAFTVPGRGRFKWEVLAQGLKPSPSIFQRFTDSIVEPCRDFARVYIDDFIIGGKTLEECKAHRDQLLSRINSAKCKINTDKSILEPMRAIPALGYLLSHDSVLPTNAYLDKVIRFSEPKSATELRKFLGLLSHILRFYPTLSSSRHSLQRYLTSYKNRQFKWSVGINEVFNNVKNILKQPTGLHHLSPDVSKEVQIVSDAGQDGFAAMLLQENKPVGFISRKYHTKAIANGGSMLREFFAISEALKYFQSTIRGRKIEIITDNQALPRAINKERQATPYLERVANEIAAFRSDLTVTWVRRNDPRIQLVDTLGRFN